MKYYYLNSEKKPVGPHTLDEILALKNSGLINDSTLAAAAGDNKWITLSQLLNKCSMWNNSNEGETNHAVEKVNINLWDCFLLGLKKYAVFRGRSSRKEFWGFYLFYSIANIAVSECSDLIVREQFEIFQSEIAQIEDGDLKSMMDVIVAYMSNATVLSTCIVATLISLVLLIPFLSVSVRRLHDTGSTSLGVIIGCASGAAVYIGMFCMYYSATMGIAILTFSLITFLFTSIYLFVKMLMPGDAKTNQYGSESPY